ncbi:MAG: hypothetical protein COA45_06815 [Zetaproteobacteria bacterium]|nr:MAG: hypothetical protein COA45_06815 [Zetaproteobacteria bacterium]
MKNAFIWAFAAFVFVFVAVSSVLILAGAHKKTLPDVSFVNRKHAVFEDEEVRRSKNRPFLIGITLHSESFNQAFFDVTYFVPKGDKRAYAVGVYPNSSNFQNSSNELKPGKNLVRVTVDFTPTSVFVRGEKTEYLNVYIYTQGGRADPVTGEVFIEKTYERKVIFPKNWRRPRPHLAPLQNTQFHWK